MEWWLVAEPKDQDFTAGPRPVARKGSQQFKMYKSYYISLLKVFRENENENGVQMKRKAAHLAVDFTKFFSPTEAYLKVDVQSVRELTQSGLPYDDCLSREDWNNFIKTPSDWNTSPTIP